MTIALDIDGVLTDLEKFMKEEGKKFYGKEVVNECGRDLDEIFAVSKEEKDAFWNAKFMEYMKEYPFREEVSEVTHRLRKAGHHVIVVTARKFYPQYNCKDEAEFQEITKEILKSRGVSFEEVYFVPIPKVSAVKDYEIDLFVEDEIRNIDQLAQHTQVAIVDASYNRGVNMSSTHRIKNLYELLSLVEELQ